MPVIPFRYWRMEEGAAWAARGTDDPFGSTIAYARIRKASPTPTSAESPRRPRQESRQARTRFPPQVTPTVPPRKAGCVDQARALAGLGRPHVRYSEQRVRESLRNSQRSKLYGRGINTATGAPSFSLSNRINTRRPEALSSSGRRPSALRSPFAPTTSARSLRSFTSSLSPFHQ